MTSNVITSKPLIGLGSIFPKSRIVIWDFKKHEAFFVGLIDSVTEDNSALGRDYHYDQDVRRWSFRSIKLNLVRSGLVPIQESTNLFSPDYRVFGLPREFRLEDRAKLSVMYEIPDRAETLKRIAQLRLSAIKQSHPHIAK
jgi:hypothetical protein